MTERSYPPPHTLPSEGRVGACAGDRISLAPKGNTHAHRARQHQPRSRRLGGAPARPARAADVPPVRRLLRRQFPHVLPPGGVPGRLPRRIPRHRRRLPLLHERPAVRVLAAHPPDRGCRAGPGQQLLGRGPEGVRFLIRSRLFTEAESQALAAEGDPPTGPALD